MSKNRKKERGVLEVPEYVANYAAPTAHYFKEKEQFDEAVGLDFITHANEGTRNGQKFLAGLSHGTSPSGAYQYILDHWNKLSRPENIRFTFVNSKLKRQRGLQDVTDAVCFLKTLLATDRISKDQILGRSLNRDDMEAYSNEMNEKLLHELNGSGAVFLTHTKLNGAYALRLVVGQTYVERSHVEKAWQLIKDKSGNLL